MAEVVGGGEDRRLVSRREDDRWIVEMIEEIVAANNKALAHQRARSRRALRSLAVGYLILMLGLAFGLWQLERHDRERFDKALATASDAQKDADLSAYKGCQRVNRLRRQSNDGSEIIFVTLWTSAERERSLARQTPGRIAHERSARVLEFLARRAKHTNLTNCQLATYDAAHYTPPRPHPFNPKTDPVLQLVRALLL